MAISVPAIASTYGDALKVRHVYLASTTKSYFVWVCDQDGKGKKFVYKEKDAADYSDAVINTTYLDIKNFYVFEHATPNQVQFLFDDGSSIWSMVVNFVTNVVVSGPTKEYVGRLPNLFNDGTMRAFYKRDDNLKLRNNITDPELTVITPTANDIFDQDMARKGSSSIVRYASNYSPNAAVALPFNDDANTRIWYDGTVVGTDLIDKSISGIDASIDSLPHFNNQVVFNKRYDVTITNWPIGSSITIEAWVLPQLGSLVAYVLNCSELQFKYFSSGKLQFMFADVAAHQFTQTGQQALVAGRYNHVLVSHIWGSPGDTFMTINGRPVTASWTTGNGTEVPGWVQLTSAINLGLGDILGPFRISNLNKTQAQVLDYIQGRRQ